jgi:L-serine dehydratase
MVMSKFSYTTARELINFLNKENILFHEFILKKEKKLFGTSSEKILKKLQDYLIIMRQSIENGLKSEYKSLCLDNETQKLMKSSKKIMSNLEFRILLSSLAVSVNNCNMGRIIACPTAGSCGILPGALLSVAEKFKKKDSQIINSILVSGEIGRLIANKTGISGASGGCMAECGVASAMSAGAIVYLFDNNPETVFNAAAIAFKNNFGLVCDPVAGLVEVPCVKRNAIKSVESLSAAQLALAGIKSLIPFDEVVEAGVEVAAAMPEKFRETAEGGLATTKTGEKIRKKIFNS